MTLERPDDPAGQAELPFDPPIARFPPLASNPFLATRGCHLILDNTIVRHGPEQLELDLAESRPRIVKFAPRRAYAFLDYGIITLFGADPLTRRAALRLERRGVWTIGDLISCPRQLVFATIERDAVALNLIEEQLREFDIEFGAAIPLWRGSQGFCELTPTNPRAHWMRARSR